MPKDILLYGDINSVSSADFINAIDENADGEISVRINSGGGSPEYGWGMIAKFSEHTGKKSIKVDGQAHSMALYFLCYCSGVEALDVSEYVLHRAAYSPWFESNAEYFTQPVRENLERVNASLRTAFEAKVDVKKFEELKGVKLKDVFSMDSRIDVVLSASEAKKIGLIDKIVKITPEKRSEIEVMIGKAARFSGSIPTASNENENQNQNIMTIEKLKAEHPGVFAQAVALGVTQGVSQEKDRIGAVLVFQELDPVIKAAIDSDKPLSETAKAELTLASFKKETLGKIEGGAAKPGATNTKPDDENKTEKQAAVDAFEKAAREKLGIKA